MRYGEGASLRTEAEGPGIDIGICLGTAAFWRSAFVFCQFPERTWRMLIGSKNEAGETSKDMVGYVYIQDWHGMNEVEVI